MFVKVVRKKRKRHENITNLDGSEFITQLMIGLHDPYFKRISDDIYVANALFNRS